MFNPGNCGIAVGRLSRDPVIYVNKDGSRKILFNLAVKEGYKDRDGNPVCQFISFESFVPACWKSNGIYDKIHKGTSLRVQYAIRTGVYKKNEQNVYTQKLQVQAIQLDEGKSETHTPASDQINTLTC